MSLHSSSGQVDPEALDGDHRDEDHEEEQDHRHGRAESDLQPSDRGPVGQQRERLGAVRTVGHDEDVVEDPEGIQCPEEHGDHDRRLHVRQDHPAHPFPPGGAVDLGRLGELAGHLRQPGQQQQGDERCRLPDLGRHDDEQRRGGGAEPVEVRPDARQPREPLVHVARVDVEHVEPGEGRDHRDDAVRDQDGRTQPALEPSDGVVHDQGQQEPEDELDDDGDDGDQHGDAQVAPEDRIGQHHAVVGQADEPAVRGGRQSVVEQRVVDRLEDRVDRHGDHDDEGGPGERPAEAALALRPLGQRGSYGLRRGHLRGVDGGGHSSRSPLSTAWTKSWVCFGVEAVTPASGVQRCWIEVLISL
ncbi:hypothetical protein SDC9_68570 [bioreactor metagenome]|uniref:Uncharacterized protein n=1 Tax=bioreactor metagenome TaxID=1076179 RepID=A0A644Y0S8_9ZZZZ